LEEIKPCLESAFNWEELKPHAMLKAEEERNNRLFALEARIKSHERQS